MLPKILEPMELTYKKEIGIEENPIGQANKTKHTCIKLALVVISCQKWYTYIKDE